MHVEYCQKLSLDLLKWYLIFILQSVNVMYRVDCFVDIEPSLHLWDKHHWIMVYNHFKFYWICFANFLEDLCIYVHQWYWPVVFFLVIFLSDIDTRVMLATFASVFSHSVSCLFIFWLWQVKSYIIILPFQNTFIILRVYFKGEF